MAECEKNIEEISKNKTIKRKEKNWLKKYRNLKSITSAIILIETILCIIFAIK